MGLPDDTRSNAYQPLTPTPAKRPAHAHAHDRKFSLDGTRMVCMCVHVVCVVVVVVVVVCLCMCVHHIFQERSTHKCHKQIALKGNCTQTYNISLSVAPPLMERSYWMIPSGILMAHTE